MKRFLSRYQTPLIEKSLDGSIHIRLPAQSGKEADCAVCIQFDLNHGRGLPYDLREGFALNESSFYVLDDSWSTKGAQEFPFGIVMVNSTTIHNILNDSNVFYVGGQGEERLYGFMTF